MALRLAFNLLQGDANNLVPVIVAGMELRKQIFHQNLKGRSQKLIFLVHFSFLFKRRRFIVAAASLGVRIH